MLTFMIIWVLTSSVSWILARISLKISRSPVTFIDLLYVLIPFLNMISIIFSMVYLVRKYIQKKNIKVNWNKFFRL
ncbi:hypothetical protein D1B32_12050 [Oceanobacillus profundus]|uniref:Uncharacterized protein n=1 Tax=Oceanobacillus profundus TaxID=372463 RepID=A0A417YGQ1_9BACI|nr:hypothetical protein D1B32_12050 [Oceanobacillus profundus]